jgi:meso-butanediol dehydrogenase / (S,S)-butanediol dehydrogenase / diacetyl reductase
VSARLAGKRCLVTGGGTGIGRAVARRYALEGASVVVMGRRAEKLEETAAAGTSITIAPGDVSRVDDVGRVVEAVVERHGGVDVVFHGAGVIRRNERLEQTTDDEWRTDMAVNLDGAFNVCRATIPHLLESRGALVLVASQLAHIAAPGYATYSAGKGGVLALMRSLAIDLGPSGVRVNALSPGIIDTDFAYIGRDFDAVRDQIAASLPLRRIGTTDDVAGPAVFLASDESGWMTGHSLVVDGGFTVQ